MTARPLIIGIAGGSGSGKSTVARNDADVRLGGATA
jgi:uridine kinase